MANYSDPRLASCNDARKNSLRGQYTSKAALKPVSSVLVLLGQRVLFQRRAEGIHRLLRTFEGPRCLAHRLLNSITTT